LPVTEILIENHVLGGEFFSDEYIVKADRISVEAIGDAAASGEVRMYRSHDGINFADIGASLPIVPNASAITIDGLVPGIKMKLSVSGTAGELLQLSVLS